MTLGGRQMSTDPAICSVGDARLGYMPAALPLVTGNEIVRDYRLDDKGTVDNAIRALKGKNALSSGLSFTPRGTGGQLGGRVHLYSALNRDAARAARRKDYVLAERLSKAAARLEASPEAKNIIDALALVPGAGLAGPGNLARLLSAPQLADDVTGLLRKLARARRGLKGDALPAQFAGHVTYFLDTTAIVTLHGVPAPVPVPAETLAIVGAGAVGCPVMASWEVLSNGRTMISVEPAIDMPDVNAHGEPLVNMYGTPWGKVLSTVDPTALKVAGKPTIRIPEGIPEVE